MAKKRIPSIKQSYVPAPLWKRAFAYVIDSFVVSLIVGVPFSSVLKVEQQGLGATFKFFAANPNLTMRFFAVTLVTALLAILYWAVFEFKFQQSLGKLAMKIDVRSTMKKKDLRFAQCFMRNISKFSVFLIALDCMHMFIYKTHQRYLEKVSSTEVVEKGWKL